MVVAMLVLGTLQAPTTAVVELRVQGEEPSQALAQELAKGIEGPPPLQTAAELARQLPPVTPTGKAEAVIEADRLVESGRDLYIDGKLDEATDALSRARSILAMTLEAFDEERKGAEALFRSEMYRACALRSLGGGRMQLATEILKDAIRTFPSTEPNYSEYGPENLRFYRQVRSEMDQQPMGRLRVEAGHEAAAIYLNGRLLGTTPLDVTRVYPGRYRLSARRGNDKSRIHIIDVHAGDNEIRIDLDFDKALKTDRDLALVYASAAERHRRYRHDALQMVRLLSLRGALVFWNEGHVTHLAFVDKDGNARETIAGSAGATATAADLVAGRRGDLVADEERPQRVWTWVVGGVAVAALAGGLLLGMSADSDFDSLKTRYPNRVLDGPGIDLRDSASTKQTVGNVLVDVAIVSTAATVVLYWYEGRSVATERASITPFGGPQFAGAQLRMRF
jgi:PEGA domain-containing protein